MLKKLPLLLAAFCLAISVFSQVPISPTFYGQNFWFTNFEGNPSATKVDLANWPWVVDGGSRMVRVGGHNYNYDEDDPNILSSPDTAIGYVQIVDAIRSKGCEPMISVPFDPNIGDEGKDLYTQAENAAEIVRFINKVHKRNVKYFIIANEPGADYNYYDHTSATPVITNIVLSNIRDYVKVFSVAMKSVDPTIKIIAPELEWAIPDLLDELFPFSGIGLYSLKGEIQQGPATGENYVDYMSYHTYSGYSPVLSTRELYIEEGYEEMVEYQNVYNAHFSSGSYIKMIVDEFNVGEGIPSAFDATTFDITTAPNANSFIGGQLVAEKMMGMMNANDGGVPVVEISNMWSVRENSAHGFIHFDGANYYRKPSYWHYWLLGNYFKGTFYGNTNISPPGPFRGMKAFACKTSDYVAVLVMNQTLTTNSFTLNFNGPPGSTGNANFAFPMSGPTIIGSYPNTIADKSTSLLFFDCSGNYKGMYELKQSDMSNIVTGLGNYDLTTHFTGIIPAPLEVTLNPLPGSAACINSNTTDATITLAGTVNWYELPANTSIPDGIDLAPGLYKVKVTTGCGISSTVFSVHEKSPLVDAGENKFCGVNPKLGSSALPLPASMYSWSGGSPITASPDNRTPIFSGGAGTHTLIMTATQGGCTITDTVVATIPTGLSKEAYIKDLPDDDGTEANPLDHWFLPYSPDIWIRNQQEDQTSTNPPEYDFEFDHQNPDWTANFAAVPWVYVKVRNIGNDCISGKVRLYYTTSNLGAIWHDLGALYPGKYGHWTEVGNARPVELAIGQNGTYAFKWDSIAVQPNPDPGGTGAEAHYCLLARFESPQDPMTVPEEKNTVAGINVKASNNIVQKNVILVDSNTGNNERCVLVRNIYNIPAPADLHFVANVDSYGNDFRDNGGTMMIDLGPDLYAKWVLGGKKGTGIKDRIVYLEQTRDGVDVKIKLNKVLNPFQVAMTSSHATLENITLDASQESFLCAQFEYSPGAAPAGRVYDYDARQILNGDYTGSVKYQITYPDCPKPDAGDDVVGVGIGCPATLIASPNIANNVYNWYNNNTGLFIGAGKSIQVFPTETTIYVLEMRSPNGCVDYDLVKANVSEVGYVPCFGEFNKTETSLVENEEKNIDNILPGETGISIYPNPNRGEFTLELINANNPSEVEILDVIGKVIWNKKEVKGKTIIDISAYGKGIYIVRIKQVNNVVIEKVIHQ